MSLGSYSHFVKYESHENNVFVMLKIIVCEYCWVSQLLLVSLIYFGGFSSLARSRALIRRMPPCAWLAPYTADLLAHMWVTITPTYVIGTFPLVGGK